MTTVYTSLCGNSTAYPSTRVIAPLHWGHRPTLLHQCGTMRPPADVIDINVIRLAVALHRLGEVIGIEVGSRKDMLERVAPQAHEAWR